MTLHNFFYRICEILELYKRICESEELKWVRKELIPPFGWISA